MMLPKDDRMLEMEEVEGFIATPPLRTQVGFKKSSRSSGNKIFVGGICERINHSRWGIFAVILILLTVILLIDDTSNSRGVDTSDKTQKDNTTSFPTVSSTERSPTTLPTVSSKVEPTASPQPKQEESAPPTTTQTTNKETSAPTTSAVTQEEKPSNTTAQVDASGTESGKEEAEKPSNETSQKASDLEDGGASLYPKPNQYVFPDPPLTSQQSEDLAKVWGKWEFSDKDAEKRPKDDYCAGYPHRDIQSDKFPDGAWQKDPVYLEGFLDQALKLVERAMEAILAEYGHGKKDEPDKDFDERSAMFKLKMVDLAEENAPAGKKLPSNGGWTTERSFRGLVRRLLHALITRDSFTVVLGGHSSAAGHGNLFRQSYIMQFHKVMEPIFAMLGVRLTSRNIAHGGLGTLQNSMGARDLYGDEIDVMLWDSGMTEARDLKAVDLFLRQALIGGNRVPFLYGGIPNLLQILHENADADVGQFGEALDGVKMCVDEIQAKEVPYAARFILCNGERQDMCKQEKFHANCWVERDDFTPPRAQQSHPDSQVSWHAGFRMHQIIGRVLAFTMLWGLKDALIRWKQADNYMLPDDEWHLDQYYENIRSKVTNMDPSLGNCFEFDALPKRFCNTTIHSRAEYTPRANPERSSLQSIIKPNELGYIPHVESHNIYKGPNVRNPFLMVPEGEIDVLAIVSNGRENPDNARRSLADGNGKTEIVPGLGWQMSGEPSGYCDGSWNSECNRSPDNACLLQGSNDFRGGILFNSYSGWLVMTLKDLKEGIIVAKIETWHRRSSITITKGWTSENNKQQDSRFLRGEPEPDYCDNFHFEFSIDGKVTSWDKAKFKEMSKNPQRVVEIQTLLDDPDFTKEPKDVELAMRMLGCGDTTEKTFKLTHMYWA